MTDPKPIVPSFVVQEEGSRKVLVYLDIPELRVKRSFPNLIKKVPSNGQQINQLFQNQSFTFKINVRTRTKESRIYALSIARLPSEIEPQRCSIKYQRGGCWITLIKAERMSWMNRICDDLTPGLDTKDYETQMTQASASVEETQLRDTNMPPPFNLVPLAPAPPSSKLTSQR